jgi:hypothetical protein
LIGKSEFAVHHTKLQLFVSFPAFIFSTVPTFSGLLHMKYYDIVAAAQKCPLSSACYVSIFFLSIPQ